MNTEPPCPQCGGDLSRGERDGEHVVPAMWMCKQCNIILIAAMEE